MNDVQGIGLMGSELLARDSIDHISGSISRRKRKRP